MGRALRFFPKSEPLPDDVPMSSDEFATPPKIARPLFQFWGKCGDPCSNDRSIVQTHDAYTFGGLNRPWWNQTYSNWPYSTNEPWTDKAIYEMRIRNVSELVVLCMTAASTVWWKKLMTLPKRNPRVICTGRLKFIGPDGVPTKDTSRFDPALIYYGSRIAKFDREFKHVTMWSTWGR